MVNKNITLKVNNVCVMSKQHETAKAVLKSPCSNSNHSDIFNKFDKFSRLEGNLTFKFFICCPRIVSDPISLALITKKFTG